MCNTTLSKVSNIVVDNIISKLESGVIPWSKPWTELGAINYISRRKYRGINTLLLSRPGEYITMKKVNELGGKVKKGSHPDIVVLWKECKAKVKNDEEDTTNNTDNSKEEDNEIFRYYKLSSFYKLFHIDDVEGLESKIKPEEQENPYKEIETMLDDYYDLPDIQFNKRRNPVYDPVEDVIYMLSQDNFSSPEQYYITLFRLVIQSTGHKSRLDRVAYSDQCQLRDKEIENLIAEIGSATMCSMAGLFDCIEDTASYINHWLEIIKGDKSILLSASQQSQKALDLIFNVEF